MDEDIFELAKNLGDKGSQAGNREDRSDALTELSSRVKALPFVELFPGDRVGQYVIREPIARGDLAWYSWRSRRSR